MILRWPGWFRKEERESSRRLDGILIRFQIPKRETFERSKLNWRETTEPEHAETLAWYRDLIRLRRSEPSLNDGEPGHTPVAYDDREKWLLMRRGSVSVCCNLGESSRGFPAPEDSKLLLASRGALQIKEGSIVLPADTVAVLQLPNAQK